MPPRQQKIPISSDDNAFFHRFYENYNGFLYYIAAKYAQSPSDREDIVQDALIRLMCNISTLRQLSQFKTTKYIALTVRSAYLDLIRKQQGKQEITLDESELESLLEMDPLLSRDPTDLQLEIIHLKESMSRKDWMILEGKYLLGYDQEELSRLTGVSPDSVRMTLSRARAKARSILLSDKEKEDSHHG